MSADESQRVALWMASQGYATGHGDTIEDMLGELEWQAKERGARPLEAVMRRVEPHLDAIVCYASSMDEHEPNRIAHDFRKALRHA